MVWGEQRGLSDWENGLRIPALSLASPIGRAGYFPAHSPVLTTQEGRIAEVVLSSVGC